jgi:hypothetical protein
VREGGTATGRKAATYCSLPSRQVEGRGGASEVVGGVSQDGSLIRPALGLGGRTEGATALLTGDEQRRRLARTRVAVKWSGA